MQRNGGSATMHLTHPFLQFWVNFVFHVLPFVQWLNYIMLFMLFVFSVMMKNNFRGQGSGGYFGLMPLQP